MSNSSALNVARSTAVRLVPEFGEDLPPDLERAIAELGRRAGKVPTYELATVAAVAGLVLSAAQLAWTVCRDRKSDRENDQAALECKLSIAFEETTQLSSDVKTRVFRVVAEETIRRMKG